MSWPARITAVLIGLVCACVIWVFQPINNFLLNNSYIADNYIPELGMGMIAMLVLCANPLLRRFAPKFALSFHQLALVFGIILVSCSVCQFMRIFPHAFARVNRDAIREKVLNDIHRSMNLPSILYIDKITGKEADATGPFLEKSEAVKDIPWSAWVGPAFVWGIMAFSCFLMMCGMALILFPQWRDNERLSFPLLTVQQSLIEDPEKGRLFPPIFTNRIFWFGFGLVFIIHAMNGLNHHTGQLIPTFPLKWNLWNAFSQGMWGYMDWYVKSGSILFIMVGITYFMPNRVGFSLWFTMILLQIYKMIGYEYFAPFFPASVDENRNGATYGVALVILWLGRKHWMTVFKSMFRRADTDEDVRNRTAGWIFSSGLIVLLSWEIWAGIPLLWSLVFIGVFFVTSLIMARVVAETGFPFIANYTTILTLLYAVPIKFLTAKIIFFGGIFDFIVGPGTSRTSATVYFLHAFGLNKDNKPRQTASLGKWLLGVILAGCIVMGAVHLWLGYTYRGSVDGDKCPISWWGSMNGNWGVHDPMKAYERGSWNNTIPYNQPLHLAAGFILGAGLQIMCLVSPNWPLHPIGLLMMNGWFLGMSWFSIFLGWTLKNLITGYGGARAYRLAKPLFLGFILGEVFSAILWALVPVIIIALGGNPTETGHIVIVPQ